MRFNNIHFYCVSILKPGENPSKTATSVVSLARNRSHTRGIPANKKRGERPWRYVSNDYGGGEKEMKKETV